jgi:hypothetical protein
MSAPSRVGVKELHCSRPGAVLSVKLYIASLLNFQLANSPSRVWCKKLLRTSKMDLYFQIATIGAFQETNEPYVVGCWGLTRASNLPFSCLHLLSAGVTGMNHHAWLGLAFLRIPTCMLSMLLRFEY